MIESPKGARIMALADDDRPIKKTAHEIGADISEVSEGELAGRIDLLKSEIARLETAIAARRASRAAADQVFKF